MYWSQNKSTSWLNSHMTKSKRTKITRDAYRLLQTDSEVNDRHIGSGDTESHTSQFTVKKIK